MVRVWRVHTEPVIWDTGACVLKGKFQQSHHLEEK